VVRSLRVAAALAGAALLVGEGASTAVGGPVASVGPTVIGTAAAGKELTGLSGTWGGFGAIAYAFQWYRCNAAGASCLAVHGATSPTYALGSKDIGKTLGMKVSATDSTGRASAYSSLVGPIAPKRPLLESTAQPVVTGPPVVGKAVQVTTGTWSPVPTGLSYQWERCNPNGRACAAIANATTSSYTAASADLGHALVAVIRATNAGTMQDAFSTSTAAVVGADTRGPAVTFPPTVAGLAVAGQTLGARTGLWKGVGSVLFSFRWYRCNDLGGHCALITTATSSTYTATPKDVSDTIGLSLTASDSTGKTTTVYASLVGPIAPSNAPLTATTAPTVSGTERVGGTLTADYGQWSVPPSSYGVAWLRCNLNGRACTAIAKATGASYQPVAADAGHTLVADVSATAGGELQHALTAATEPIAAD
jgi:hypothetical protein